MTANELFERVQDYMDSVNLKYDAEYNEQRPLIRSGMRIDCKLKSTNTYFIFGDDGYSSIACVNMSADEETMGAVATYITMANWGLRDGCFELNLENGEVRYRSFVPGTCDELSDETISKSIGLPVYMLEKYGNGLLAVMMGFSDPITEIRKAESDREDEGDEE